MSNNHKQDKMMYQNNKLSYRLMFLGIATDITYIVFALNTVNTQEYGIFTGVKVLFNIVLLLIIFLSMEKIKVYNKKYALFMMGLSALMVLRIFWFPMFFIKGQYLSPKFQSSDYKTRAILMIILMVVTIVSFMTASIIGYRRAKVVENRRKMVENNGK